jgi:hypothetical protein
LRALATINLKSLGSKDRTGSIPVFDANNDKRLDDLKIIQAFFIFIFAAASTDIQYRPI